MEETSRTFEAMLLHPNALPPPANAQNERSRGASAKEKEVSMCQARSFLKCRARGGATQRFGDSIWGWKTMGRSPGPNFRKKCGTEVKLLGNENPSSCRRRRLNLYILPQKKPIRLLETVFSVLKLYVTRERKSIRLPEAAVPVLNLYCQRTKSYPVGGDSRSSTKVVLPENENPSGCRRRPLQF